MLDIHNLHVTVEGKPILNGISLSIKPGEIHAIMGPNGSGKSTLSNVLTGRSGYEVVEGQVTYEGVDLLDQSPEARAQQGIFLAFQYPVEIPGVNNIYLLKAAYNARRKAQGLKEIDAYEFLEWVKARLQWLHMDEQFLYRDVNAGFSGGEKKRNEILQMLVLEPQLAILDETDSGLDIDALKVVAEGVNRLRDSHRSFIVITHYQRLLDYIIPDYVHVLSEGRIIKSGGSELAHELEKTGYGWITNTEVTS